MAAIWPNIAIGNIFVIKNRLFDIKMVIWPKKFSRSRIWPNLGGKFGRKERISSCNAGFKTLEHDGTILSL